MTFSERIDHYFEWYFSEKQKWYEIPIKLILAIPTTFFIIILYVMEYIMGGDTNEK